MYSSFGFLSDTFRANGAFERFTPFPVEEGFYVAKKSPKTPKILKVPKAAYTVLTKPGKKTVLVQNMYNVNQSKKMVLNITSAVKPTKAKAQTPKPNPNLNPKGTPTTQVLPPPANQTNQGIQNLFSAFPKL